MGSNVHLHISNSKHEGSNNKKKGIRVKEYKKNIRGKVIKGIKKDKNDRRDKIK